MPARPTDIDIQASPKPARLDGTNCFGVVLAGGSGNRLGGVDKSLVRVGGIPLWRRTVHALTAQCAQIYFSAGPSELHDDLASISNPQIRDTGEGPAHALVTVATQLTTLERPPVFLLSVAVDTPFFPEDFLISALQMMTTRHGAVVATYGGRDYPTNALWRLSALTVAARSLKSGPKAPALFGLLDLMDWQTLDYGELSNFNPFQNVNRVEDLLNCNRQALVNSANSIAT